MDNYCMRHQVIRQAGLADTPGAHPPTDSGRAFLYAAPSHLVCSISGYRQYPTYRQWARAFIYGTKSFVKQDQRLSAIPHLSAVGVCVAPAVRQAPGAEPTSAVATLEREASWESGSISPESRR
jgi:hypothetical protein